MEELKKYEVPEKVATEWMASFDKKNRETFGLTIENATMLKATWTALGGAEKKRVRIYFGLDLHEKTGTNLCAFAVSTTTDSKGVNRDAAKPVFLLDKANTDLSSDTGRVIASLKAFAHWRKAAGESGGKNFPKAMLLHNEELEEILVARDSNSATITFGYDGNVRLVISSGQDEKSTGGAGFFDFAEPCPPICDTESEYFI